MEKGKSTKKTRAALVAGALAGAIALTGTMAWLNMNQEIINEFRQQRNPGGRLHDDFNGMENKDIYAENFTGEEDGEPVYVRVRLLEYMEIGEDAGINRDAVDADGDGKPDRAVTVLAASAKDAAKDANINDTTTWRIHKPDSGTDVDPFHEYWSWVQDGMTTYMPTFNKNKDSLSVDVNGTYVGTDDVFETGTPYDDYQTYTVGETLERDAYYDADTNDVDENLQPDGSFAGEPGAGGSECTAINPTGNFTKEKETHAADTTLNSLGVISMQDWLDADMPICNKWVWDEDGWFYWPEPVMPQTATGLLLNKLEQVKMPNEKCYYAIEVVGQFASAGDWGTPAGTDSSGDPVAATGFYADDLTENAVILLNNATTVELGEDNGWYLYQGENVYKKILDDAGTLSAPICAGEDLLVGNSDDRTDLEYVEGGLTVDGTLYGSYFLKPAGDVNYYRAPGRDGYLGTSEDARLWLTAGDSLTTGTVLDKVVDQVVITPPEDFTPVEEGKIEAEIGATLTFSAAAKLGEEDSADQSVTWSVAAGDGSTLKGGTHIDPDSGELTIAADETVSTLTVTATSKLDDRQSGTYRVKVIGKRNVRVFAQNGATRIQAGTSLKVTARLYRGEELVPEAEQPTEYTWCEAPTLRSLPSDTLKIEVDPSDKTTATVTIGRGIEVGKHVVITASCAGVTEPGECSLEVAEAAAVTVQLTSPSSLRVMPGGEELSFSAVLTNSEQLEDDTVAWTVGTSVDSGDTLQAVEGVNIDEHGVLTVAESYQLSRGKTVYVHATANDGTAVDSDGQKVYAKSEPITIVGPHSVEVTVADGGEAMIHAGTRSTLQMKAEVKDADGNPYPSDLVTWSVTGQHSVTAGANTPATTIDADGLLHMGNLEYQGTMFHVTATSQVDPDISGSLDVEVGPYLLDGREITLSGNQWIVLSQVGALDADGEGYYTLLISKYTHSANVFATQNNANWMSSYCSARKACEDWLNLSYNSALKNAVVPLNTSVRKTADSEEFDTYRNTGLTMPSEADLFGTTNGQTPKDNDYYWGAQFQIGKDILATKPVGDASNPDASNVTYWLRSLHSPTDGSSGTTWVGTVDDSGNLSAAPYNSTCGYRILCCVYTEKIKSLLPARTTP